MQIVLSSLSGECAAPKSIWDTCLIPSSLSNLRFRSALRSVFCLNICMRLERDKKRDRRRNSMKNARKKETIKTIRDLVLDCSPTTHTRAYGFGLLAVISWIIGRQECFALPRWGRSRTKEAFFQLKLMFSGFFSLFLRKVFPSCNGPLVRSHPRYLIFSAIIKKKRSEKKRGEE